MPSMPRFFPFTALIPGLALALLTVSCNNPSGPDAEENPSSSSALAQNSSDSSSPSSNSRSSSSTAGGNSSGTPSSSSQFSWDDFCWPGSGCDVSSSSGPAATSSSSSATLIGVIMSNKMWDQRDDQLYDLTKIAGKFWTSNMNYHTNDGSSCYGDAEKNCTDYGRLYTYPAALEACPTGWRLPTSTEVRSAWQEGMTIPYGGREKSGVYGFLGDMGFMWTANPSGIVDVNNCGDLPSGSCAVLMVDHNPSYNDKGQILQLDSRYKGFSVRCVQN